MTPERGSQGRERLRIYGTAGCGPCEIAKMFFGNAGVGFAFVDLASDSAAHARLRERLPDVRSGVVLEPLEGPEAGELTTMVGVSIAKLQEWTRRALPGDEA